MLAGFVSREWQDESTFHTALPIIVPRSGGTIIKPSITIMLSLARNRDERIKCDISDAEQRVCLSVCDGDQITLEARCLTACRLLWGKDSGRTQQRTGGQGAV